MRFLPVVLGIVILAGCVPLRNEYSPSVIGTISSAGKSEAGAAVCLKTSEIQKPQCVLSDAVGRFRLLPIKHFEMASVADHYTWYELKIQTQAGTVLGYTDNFSVGMVESVDLTCDLAAPVRKGCAAVYCKPRKTGSVAESGAVASVPSCGQ